MDSGFVSNMGWRVDPYNLLDANLADCNKVPIFGMCRGLEWLLHDTLFKADFLFAAPRDM